MPDIIKSADNACECVIKTINGMPRLVIDGKTVAPVLFFGNTDINCAMVTKQVKMAAENGIHLHSVIYNLHFTPDKPACCLSDEFSGDEYGDLDRCLDAVISGDPDARIFLRVKVGAYFKEAPEEWKDELITFADGSVYPAGSDLCLVSTSSDRWADEVCRKLRAITEYMRSDERYAAHLACVHLENCEWFEYGFRENGSDVSRPANLKFARWQLEKYGADYKPFAVPRDLPNNISSELYRSGLSFAFAEINDVAEGRFADGRLFVFLNPYRIEHDCALRLADALYGKNSVWMYGFGTTESRDAALLTGMETELCASGSTAFDSDTLDGAFVPSPRSNTVTHRWKVKAGADKIMGGYDDGIKGAFAESAHNGGKCWFWGGTSLGRENLRAFAARSGVMLYTDMPDMTVTDGKTLVLCAASSGEKTVHTARGDIRFALNAGETRILDI